MARFKASLLPEQNTEFKVSLSSDENMNLDFGEITQVVDPDYNKLENKPTINGVEVSGDLTSEDLKLIYKGTKSYWDSQSALIAEAGALYIYTDYKTIDNGDGTYTISPGLKVGDGTSYLIDMPFMSADSSELQTHILDNTAHVTADEKDFWNNKWSGYIDANNPENLYFTTDRIVLGGNLYA